MNKKFIVRLTDEERGVGQDGGSLQMRADYKYDMKGNRIQKAVDTDGDTDIDTTERYAYDWWKTCPQTDFIGNENSDAWADLNGSSSLTTRHLRGDVIDQIFARTDAGTSEAYWLLTDRLGSLRNVVDDTQTVKNNIVYDGWGNVTSESDPVYGGRYKWTGREFDVETQLQYNRARYYDGKMGRWISQDPLGFEAGDSNLYRYVSNEVTFRTDPSGQIIVTILHIPKLRTTGAFDDVKWRFELHKQAPEDGYIVQKIKRELSYIEYFVGGQKRSVSEVKTFWEAWFVKKGQTLDTVHDAGNYTDSSAFAGRSFACGAFKAAGEIKFFYKSATGDLGDPAEGRAPDQNTGWGGNNQEPLSGGLPSTKTPPAWWNNQPANGEPVGSRSLTVEWSDIKRKWGKMTLQARYANSWVTRLQIAD